MGDFNSDAGGSDTPTYGLLTGTGFRDAWLESRPRTSGLTCCHAPDLRNETTNFRMRIDLVLLGSGFQTWNGGRVGRVRATVVGDEPGDRTPSGLWPSDHAGVVVTFRPPSPVAHR